MFVRSPPQPQNRLKNKSLTKKQPIIPKTPLSKSLQNKAKRQKRILIAKKFAISHEKMNEVIEQQKINDLQLIRKSVALQHYYQTMISLFMLMYSTSQVIASNIFESKEQTTGLSSLKFIGFFIGIFQKIWNEKNRMKLKMIAKSIMKMGSTPSIFQQKIEFVARKIALNHNMKKRIEMAFLNPKLNRFWTFISDQIKLKQDVQILEDMYELAPQKIAYWDFSFFLNQYLSNQQFYETLKQLQNYKKIEGSKNERIHDFTYEFMLIEIFCFREEGDIEAFQKDKYCQLI